MKYELNVYKCKKKYRITFIAYINMIYCEEALTYGI